MNDRAHIYLAGLIFIMALVLCQLDSIQKNIKSIQPPRIIVVTNTVLVIQGYVGDPRIVMDDLVWRGQSYTNQFYYDWGKVTPMPYYATNVWRNIPGHAAVTNIEEVYDHRH